MKSIEKLSAKKIDNTLTKTKGGLTTQGWGGKDLRYAKDKYFTNLFDGTLGNGDKVDLG